jgi:hypothetical protein
VQLSFCSSGDLGDILASLPAVRALGGGDYYFVDRPVTKTLSTRAHLIQPLLEAQPYIRRVIVGEPVEGPNLRDFSTFRSGGLPWGVTLGQLQARWVGIEDGAIEFRHPWLTAKPAQGYADKLIVARSSRYQNFMFPWKEIVQFCGPDIVFIGLPEEHRAFCDSFGAVEYLPTKDLLEAATVISGAAGFIGNQSSPFNVAEGLKVPRVLECCLWTPDCCYGGGDVQYVPGGALVLNHPSKPGEQLRTEQWAPPPQMDTSRTPHGGWIYDMPNGMKVRGVSFQQAVIMIAQAFRSQGVQAAPPADIGAALIEQTLVRLPSQPPHWFQTQLDLFTKIKALVPTHNR